LQLLYGLSQTRSLIPRIMNTVVKETHSPHPPGGAPGPFSLYDENILKESFIRSGFKDIALERMNVACEFDSAESYEIFTYELHSMLVNETEERRKEILEAAITESTIKYVGKYWQCKVK